jgi:hypothetical protein
MNSRGRYIFKKARKVRWKKVVKYKSIHWGHNFRLKKNHITYPMDISNIFNKTGENKWKQIFFNRIKQLQSSKEIETINKRFMGR